MLGLLLLLPLHLLLRDAAVAAGKLPALVWMGGPVLGLPGGIRVALLLTATVAGESGESSSQRLKGNPVWL